MYMNETIAEAMLQRVQTTQSLGLEKGQVWVVQFKKGAPAITCGVDSVDHASNCVSLVSSANEGNGGVFYHGMMLLSDIKMLSQRKDLKW